MPIQHQPPTQAVQRLRTLVRVRWLAGAFALVQLLTYDTLPYPPGIREAGFVLVALMGLGNLAQLLALRGTPRRARIRGTAVAGLASDVVLVSALTALFAFDALSALFAVLVLLPIEGALLFGLPGAAWTWAATAVLYVGREWFATRYANPFELSSVTFRVGIIGLVALIVGIMARDLQGQRRRAEEALAEARRADAWRGRVVAMLAHDLRSPLAGIKMGLTTLQSQGDRLTPEVVDVVVSGNVRQVERLLTMTRDLLDLARAEDGRLVLDRRTVRVADVVANAVDLLGLDPHLVHVDVADGLRAHADAERLEQVLANLLTNAVRHGAPPIEVVATADGDTVQLEVRDHGPGLPVGMRDTVFEPFTSSDGSAQSVGLGTWVVAEMVRAHGGTVEHEDALPGARFVIRLPGALVSPASASLTAGPSPA